MLTGRYYAVRTIVVVLLQYPPLFELSIDA